IASILIKLAICYGVIGYTDGINSDYTVILLLPVVAAATTLNGLGTTIITVLACCSYLSFLLILDWEHYEFTPIGISYLGLRVIFLPVVAFLTFELAEANRNEAKRSQAVAEQLANANQSL